MVDLQVYKYISWTSKAQETCLKYQLAPHTYLGSASMSISKNTEMPIKSNN